MIVNKPNVQESQLFSYVVSSADMYYNPISERKIYLYDNPTLGLVIRGNMRGIDRKYDVNLSQILLEYAMSCEEPYSQERANNAPICMGERLGKLLAKKLHQDMPDYQQYDELRCMFELILRSMNVQFEVENIASEVHFYLEDCPMLAAAQKTGIYRAIVPARRGFIALCNGVLCSIAPNWRMLHPSPWQADKPLREIMLQRVA